MILGYEFHPWLAPFTSGPSAEPPGTARFWMMFFAIFGRRNLTAFQRAELALQLKPVVKAEAKSNLVVSTGGANPRPLQKSEKVAPIHTDERIAKVAGVSRDTLRKAEVIKEEGTRDMPLSATKKPPPVRAAAWITWLFSVS